MKKTKVLSTKAKRNRQGYLYVLPWVVGVLCFQFGPIVLSFFLSFTKYSMFGTPDFIGIENYKSLFNDVLFTTSTAVTFKYVFMSVPFKIIFALIVALIMNQKIRGVNFYRTAYYIPSIFGSNIAVSIIWKMLFVKDGIINLLLEQVGIEGPAWLGDGKLVIPTLALLSVWQFGSSMVIFLAGLKQIPSSYYEAASVDGAGRMRKFISITIPGIMPMITYNLLMQTINAFQVFAPPYTIFGNGNGPLNQGLVLALYLYRNAFRYFDMGYSAAISWSLLVMIAATAFVIHLIDKRINQMVE